MAAVGSLIFCVTCGNLLDSAVGKKKLNCNQCEASYDAKLFADLSVVTTSAEDAFPSALKLKRSVVKTQLGKEHLEEGAIVSSCQPTTFIHDHYVINKRYYYIIRSKRNVLNVETKKCNIIHYSSEVLMKV